VTTATAELPNIFQKFLQDNFVDASSHFKWRLLDILLRDIAQELNQINNLEKDEREAKPNVIAATALRKCCVIIHHEKIKLVMAGYKLGEKRA
jgi:hypothetical protein